MILISLNNLQNHKKRKKKSEKPLTHKNAITLLNLRQKVLDDLKSGIFPKGRQIQGKQRPSMLAHEGHLTKMSDHKVSDHKQVKIFTKKMLQRLKIAFS